MSKMLFDHRLSVSVTDKMGDLLEDIAITRTRKGNPIAKADLIREAIRLYLDEQADARGSRKQIAKSLEGQMEALVSKIESLNEQMNRIHEVLGYHHNMLVQLKQDLQPVIDRVKPRPQ